MPQRGVAKMYYITDTLDLSSLREMHCVTNSGILGICCQSEALALSVFLVFHSLIVVMLG